MIPVPAAMPEQGLASLAPSAAHAAAAAGCMGTSAGSVGALLVTLAAQLALAARDQEGPQQHIQQENALHGVGEPLQGAREARQAAPARGGKRQQCVARLRVQQAPVPHMCGQLWLQLRLMQHTLDCWQSRGLLCGRWAQRLCEAGAAGQHRLIGTGAGRGVRAWETLSSVQSGVKTVQVGSAPAGSFTPTTCELGTCTAVPSRMPSQAALRSACSALGALGDAGGGAGTRMARRQGHWQEHGCSMRCGSLQGGWLCHAGSP